MLGLFLSGRRKGSSQHAQNSQLVQLGFEGPPVLIPGRPSDLVIAVRLLAKHRTLLSLLSSLLHRNNGLACV